MGRAVWRRLGRGGCLSPLPWMLGSSRLHEEVTSHFDVQRRAELGAVVRVHTRCISNELNGFSFACLKAETDILATDHESVRCILRVLDVRDVHRDILAFLDLDDVRGDVTAHHRHVDDNFIAFDLYALITLGGTVWVPIIDDWIPTDLA